MKCNSPEMLFSLTCQVSLEFVIVGHSVLYLMRTRLLDCFKPWSLHLAAFTNTKVRLEAGHGKSGGRDGADKNAEE